jgi:hypothetical protein
VAFGLASLTRPESIVAWALAMAATLPMAHARVRRALWLAAVPTLLVHGGFLIWRHACYGSWIPNSVVAKWGGGAMAGVLGAKYALASLMGTVGILGLGLLGLPGVLRRGVEWTFLASLGAAYLGFAVASGGDWMPGYRLLVPMLPALWVLGAAALAETIARLTPRVSPWSAAAIVPALAAGGFAGERFLVRAQPEYPTGLRHRTWVGPPERVLIAKDIRRIVPAGATIAMGDCGFVPYFNPDLRILDLFGLMDPGIARLSGPHTRKLTTAYFLEKSPPYCLMMVKRTTQGAGGATVPSHPDGGTLLASDEFRARDQAIRSYSGFLLHRRRS